MNGRYLVEDYDTEDYDTEDYDTEDYYDPRSRRWVVTPRQPIGRVQPMPVNGVDRANLMTPRGNATLNLPERVVTVAEYQQSTQRLENAINRLADRNNSLQGDLQGYDRQVGSTLSSTRRNIAREKTAINKLRDEVRSQSMFNMLINFITIQQLQQDLKNHKHLADPDGTGAVDASTISSSNNDILLLLPLLMGMGSTDDNSSDNKGFGGNNMMMLFVLLIATQGSLFGSKR